MKIKEFQKGNQLREAGLVIESVWLYEIFLTAKRSFHMQHCYDERTKTVLITYVLRPAEKNH